MLSNHNKWKSEWPSQDLKVSRILRFNYTIQFICFSKSKCNQGKTNQRTPSIILILLAQPLVPVKTGVHVAKKTLVWFYAELINCLLHFYLFLTSSWSTIVPDNAAQRLYILICRNAYAWQVQALKLTIAFYMNSLDVPLCIKGEKHVAICIQDFVRSANYLYFQSLIIYYQ